MAIILDIFGVLYTNEIDKNILNLTDKYRAQGHKIYLASNVEASKVSIFMYDFKLKNHVDNLFCSGELGVSKPSFQFYDRITASINETPSDIIFFDDSIINVEGAQKYGWTAHLYRDVKEMKLKIDDFLKDQKL